MRGRSRWGAWGSGGERGGGGGCSRSRPGHPTGCAPPPALLPPRARSPKVSAGTGVEAKAHACPPSPKGQRTGGPGPPQRLHICSDTRPQLLADQGAGRAVLRLAPPMRVNARGSFAEYPPALSARGPRPVPCSTRNGVLRVPRGPRATRGRTPHSRFPRWGLSWQLGGGPQGSKSSRNERTEGPEVRSFPCTARPPGPAGMDYSRRAFREFCKGQSGFSPITPQIWCNNGGL